MGLFCLEFAECHLEKLQHCVPNGVKGAYVDIDVLEQEVEGCKTRKRTFDWSGSATIDALALRGDQ